MEEPVLPFRSHPFRNMKNVGYLSPNEKCLLAQKRYLYKYLNKDAFQKTLQYGLRFARPSTWTDQFERRFYDADYSKIAPNLSKDTFAACFAYDKENEAAWRSYMYNDIKTNSLCFRLTINRKRLREAMKKDGRCVYYEGPVVYLREYTIVNLHLCGVPGAKSLHNAFFHNRDFRHDDFLSLMLLKREFFKHENEIRYFAVPKQEIADEYIYIDLGLDPGSNSIIEKVTVTRPFGNFKLTEEELDQIAEELPIDRDLLETFNPYDDYDGPVVFDKCVK